MKRRLIATLVAAVALAPALPRPMEASDGADLLGLLLGIGTLHAIGQGIERARAPLPEPAPVSRSRAQ